MKRWLAFAPLGALAALALLFALFALKHDPHVNPAALVGKPVPALTLSPLEPGAPVALVSEAKGPMLINVFASWCVPCVQEAPALMALKADGVRILGIAYKNKPDDVRGFLVQRGNPFTTIVMDPDGRAGVEFGVSGVPETFAVNSHGTIVGKQTGVLTPEAAESLLDKARR